MGIECPMSFSLRFDLKKGVGLRPWSYRFTTRSGSLQPRSDERGYFAVTALGPDLIENAKHAIRDLISWLGREHGLSREDAYLLCSLAADLKISQIVNQPYWGVSAYLTKSVFE
jgi:acetamidase/formamidase